MISLGSIYQVNALINEHGELVGNTCRYGYNGRDRRGRYENYKLLDFCILIKKENGYVNMYNALFFSGEGMWRSTVDIRELFLIKKINNESDAYIILNKFNSNIKSMCIEHIRNIILTENGTSIRHQTVAFDSNSITINSNYTNIIASDSTTFSGILDD